MAAVPNVLQLRLTYHSHAHNTAAEPDVRTTAGTAAEPDVLQLVLQLSPMYYSWY